MSNTPDLHITKNKTSIEWYKENKTLVATRLVCGTLVTFTTKEPKTIGEFATRVNNFTGLSDENFKILEDVLELLEDTEYNELCGLELV